MLNQNNECPINMDERLERVELEVREEKSTVIILDERQQRLHEDFRKLTTALTDNTKAVSEINTLISNRKGFVAGVLTVVTIIGSVLAAILGSALDWFK